MTSEERPSSGQQHNQLQKRRAWLRRASTSSDNQPPPQRSSGRRLSAYDRIISERVRRGITVSLGRRSSVVSTGSSDQESFDSSSGSSSGSGFGNGSRSASGSGSGSGSSGCGSGSRETTEMSLRPLAPRADPLDETQMTTSTAQREGAARCQQADGVPLLDHLIQLAAERGAKEAAQQGSDGKPTEQPEEKKVRFREGWRSARGTGSISALHEDEVKSVAERMTPCGILKNGNSAAKKEEPKENGDISGNAETAEKISKSANRHAVENIALESEPSETEKAVDISVSGESPLAPASAEESYENDDVFEPKAATPENANDSSDIQPDIENADGTSLSTENTNGANENAPSTVQSSDEIDVQKVLNAEAAVKSGEKSPSASADDITCEILVEDKYPAKASDSVREENNCEKESKDDQVSSECVLAIAESAPSTDIQEAAITVGSGDALTSCPFPATSPSSNKPRRSRLDSVPEEPPTSPKHLPNDQTPCTSHDPATSTVSGGEGGDPSSGARQRTLSSSQLRSARGVPSRRWSVSGEPTSHRRDRAAISRRLVYLTLSEEDGEPVPVFEEPAGGAVEFNSRQGEWRPLTGEESQRLAQRRRMSLTKTCSLDFDRIP